MTRILQIKKNDTTKKDPNLLNMFSHFEDILNHTHLLFTLAQKVRWSIFEEAFYRCIARMRGDRQNLSG